MMYVKSTGYRVNEVALARYAKALGHPARIVIMKKLASMPDCCFTDILNDLPIAQSTVSQHLSELKDAGLIRGSINPPRVMYCIDKNNWHKARELFAGLLDDLKAGGDDTCCT